jgi:hypothetical protein
MAVDVGPAGAVAKKFPSPDDYNKKMALISRLDSAELCQTSRSVVLAVLPKKYRTPREKSQWLF